LFATLHAEAYYPTHFAKAESRTSNPDFERNYEVLGTLLPNGMNMPRLIHFDRFTFLPEVTTQYDCMHAAVELCTLCQLHSRSAVA
jgi:hypothetical protein